VSGPLEGEKITVIGGGFVGVVAAAGFASFGHTVICVEKDAAKVARFKAGQLPFYEPNLEDLLKAGLESGRLSFVPDLENALDGQKAIFVTVGTPSAEDGRADLTALEEIVRVVSRRMQSGQILVLKSTVPVGTSRKMKELMEQNGCKGNDAHIINNPEFLREGSAVFDFFNPDRIVIGGESHEAIETVTHIYRMGMTRPVPIVTTNNETAEMIKYASNAFLATKIGFANELARLCDSVGVNVLEVARAMGMDTRIGQKFLDPGPGWGGSCLPKDLMELMGLAESEGVSLLISRAVEEANRLQHDYVVSKVKKVTGDLKGKYVAVLGLSFKADTSDMRNSPTIPILRKLVAEGARIRAFDPAAKEEAARLLPEIDLVDSPYETARDADCIIILTEWSDFQAVDWKQMGKLMRRKNIVDARNILAPELLIRQGFNYVSMGQV
jgi:UDPglucose 6-dehydrogenase